MIENLKSLKSHRNFALHPLIHTYTKYILAQSMVFSQGGQKEIPTAQCQWGYEEEGVDKEVVLSC